MVDAGPPLVLTAIGLILWLAVDATLSGISIQTIGVILAIIGVIWLMIELVVRPRRHASGRSRAAGGARTRDTEPDRRRSR